MFRSERARETSLTNHLFWGAIAGGALFWLGSRYIDALPQGAKDQLDDLIPLSTDGLSDEVSDSEKDYILLTTGALVGAGYGLSAYYFPFISSFRRSLFSIAVWGFRLSQAAALMGLIDGPDEKSTEKKVVSLATRQVSKMVVEKAFEKAERH